MIKKGFNLLGFPTQWRFIKGPLFIMCIMLFLQLLPTNLQSQFSLISIRFLDGEIWRIITGNLIHANWNHYLLNTAGLLLVWALHGEYYSFKRLLSHVSLATLSVGSLIVVFSPYGEYVGLSGVLHYLLAWGAMTDIKRKEHSGWLLFIGLLIKVSYENIFGASIETANLIESAVAVEAHAFGVLSAIICFTIIYMLAPFLTAGQNKKSL